MKTFRWILLAVSLTALMISASKRPARYQRQANGAHVARFVAANAPRPGFCAAMVVAITLLIATLAGCAQV